MKKQNKLEILTPFESMNPQFIGAADEEMYAKILAEHNQETAAEIKEDGYRIQIHKKGDVVKTFTRQMNPYVLELFPELNESLQNLPNCVLDAEILGENLVGKKGFDNIKTRFRIKASEKKIAEYLSSGIVEENPLELRVFDTLHWEGTDTFDLPLYERRKFTENISEKRITPSVQKIITDSEELQEWFENLTGKKYEGLVCKNPSSRYIFGGETTDWIKLKRAETLDVVVLGVYLDKNTSEISQLLCGTYNEKTRKYETIAKVNAKRQGMNKELSPLIEDKYLESCPGEISLNPRIEKQKDGMPDYFLSPKKSQVVEIAAMNYMQSKNWHSCGLDDEGKAYSLRIAWLKNIRLDKDYKQINTTQEIIKFYKDQN